MGREKFLAHDQDQTCFHRKEAALLETSPQKFRMRKITALLGLFKCNGEFDAVVTAVDHSSALDC